MTSLLDPFCVIKLIQEYSNAVGSCLNAVSETNSVSPVSGESKMEDMELPLFDLATIDSATNNFCNKNIIGTGGYGPVYKVKIYFTVK